MSAGSLNHCSHWDEAQARAPGGSHLAGWIYVEEREWYFQLAKEMRPGQTMVEIGTYGASTPVLVGLVAPRGVRIVAIDPFTNDTHVKGQRSRGIPEHEIETLEQLARKNIESAGLTGVIEVIARDSHAVGPEWKDPIDWLIVDGDHSYEGCTRDLLDFAPWVRSGGLLIIDDANEIQQVDRSTQDWRRSQPAGMWTLEREYAPPRGSIVALRRA